MSVHGTTSSPGWKDDRTELQLPRLATERKAALRSMASRREMWCVIVHPSGLDTRATFAERPHQSLLNPNRDGRRACAPLVPDQSSRMIGCGDPPGSEMGAVGMPGLGPGSP